METSNLAFLKHTALAQDWREVDLSERENRPGYLLSDNYNSQIFETYQEALEAMDEWLLRDPKCGHLAR